MNSGDNLTENRDWQKGYPEKNPIQVAGRLFDALELLADQEELSLREIAQKLDLNKSTAHRILASLEYMGYARQNEENGKYALTYKIAEIAGRLMSRIHIADLIRPCLKQLAEYAGETVHLVQREGADVVYIDKVESTHSSIRMISRIGSRLPFYRSGVGKAIAATLPEHTVEKLWAQSQIRQATPHTITDCEAFLHELDHVRSLGYALDDEENEEGVRCIAVSLSVGEKPARYAISISAPVGRMDSRKIQQFGAHLLAIRAQLTASVPAELW